MKKKISLLFLFSSFVFLSTLGLSALCTENNALPYPGCTDPCALNYDSNATSDDGSCILPDCDDACPLTIDELDPVTCTCTNTEPDVDDACDLTNDSFDAFNCAIINAPPDVDDGCALTIDSFDPWNCVIINTPPSAVDIDDNCDFTIDSYDEVNCVIINMPYSCDDNDPSTADYFIAAQCLCVNAIYSYQVQAIAFYDENENDILDSDEQSIQQAFNLNPSALHSYTDQSGIAYIVLEGFGEYELSLNNINPLWEFSGTNNSVQISYIDSTFNDTLNYFPMTPVGEFVVQGIDLSSSITRCNQNTNYWLTYTNQGTTINDGYVELIPDTLTTLVSADPPADSTAENKLYWFYEDLYPTHSEQIHLVYEMPSVDEIGEDINFEANIETNEGFGDHKAVISSNLVCAYDPNDKLHTPSGYGNENYTLFGDTLEYTVRFQNTGNDTAFTVVIEDQLSEFLDINTFRPIASSHNVESRIDLSSRLATFTFNDIYLPDSFVNEPGSHGFVKYQILGNENLEENTNIENTASIFFDQNPPIVTNTVNNRIVSELPSLPILSANTDVLDFGEIPLDESFYIQQTLVINNVGDLPLQIEELEFDNGFYSELDNPVFYSDNFQTTIIEGQDNIEIPIYFEPNEVGSYESEVTVKSDVGDLSIALSGTAILQTSTSHIPHPHFTISPNPSNGYVSITSLIEGNVLSYRVMNSLNEFILEETYPAIGFGSIDLSRCGKGVYFITIETTMGTFVEKVVVQ